MSGERSRNNNVFLKNGNGVWSRLLFFKSLGTEKMARELSIAVDVIQIILTPETKCTNVGAAWGRIKNIEFDATVCYDRSGNAAVPGFVFGVLPDEVVTQMSQHLPVNIVEKLIHGDYLPWIDWEKFESINGYGEDMFFKDVARKPVTLQQYTQQERNRGGGPGILDNDVEEDWKNMIARHEKTIKLYGG